MLINYDYPWLFNAQLDSSVMNGDKSIKNGVAFAWFSPVLRLGARKPLELRDIPPIPEEYKPVAAFDRLIGAKVRSEHARGNIPVVSSWVNKLSRAVIDVRESASMYPLLRRILSCHSWSIFIIFVLKMVLCALSFASPLLLGDLVELLSNGAHNFSRGIFLVVMLGACAVFSAALNTNSNARSLDVKLKLQSALTSMVFERVVSVPHHAFTDLQLSPGQLLTFVQVDIDQVSSFAQTVNDVWSLPVQIVVAFVLLYVQIRVAFVAGVAVILLMIPLNSVIARLIGWNTQQLLKNKDMRVKLMMEAMQNIASVKMTALDSVLLALSNRFRKRELVFLARRKYLDALCVFLWASTPIIVPFATFATSVLVAGEDALTSAQIITALALLNMLIFPMNALPWVINGFMEARVSLRRLAMLLNDDSAYSLDLSSYCELSQVSTSTNGTSNSSTLTVTIPAQRFIWQSPITAEAMARKQQLQPLESESAILPLLSTQPSTSSAESSVAQSTFSVGLAQPLSLPLVSNGRGGLVVVVGRTGSGKSALLLSILGQLPLQTPPPSSSNSRNTSRASSGVYSAHAIAMLQSAVILPRTQPTVVDTSSAESQLFLRKSHDADDDDDDLDVIDLQTSQSLPRSQTASSSEERPEGSWAYSAQNPAVFDVSLRENILCGHRYIRERYRRVLRGCALDIDFPEEDPGSDSEDDDEDEEAGWSEYGDITGEVQRSTSGRRRRSQFTQNLGTGGQRLSGGQRLRLGVARALYRSFAPDCYGVLLDDPFAALDAQTAQHLGVFLRREALRTNVILTTHSPSLLRIAHGSDDPDPASRWLLLQEGREEQRASSFDGLYRASAAFRLLVRDETASSSTSSMTSSSSQASSEHSLSDILPPQIALPRIPQSPGRSDASSSSGGYVSFNLQARDNDPDPDALSPGGGLSPAGNNNSSSSNTINPDGSQKDTESGVRDVRLDTTDTGVYSVNIDEQEDRKEGHISWAVISQYLGLVGFWVTVGVLVATFCMQASSSAMGIWIGIWASSPDSYTSKEFLMISTVILGANVISTTLRATLFAFAGLRACRLLYADLARRLLIYAPLSFFESSSTSTGTSGGVIPGTQKSQTQKQTALVSGSLGAVSNRLNRDTNAADDALPFIANILLAQIFQLIGAVGVMLYADMAVAVPLVLVAVFYMQLQGYYRASSRELRRLESQSRSPVYTLLCDLLQDSGAGLLLMLSGGAERVEVRWMRRRLHLALLSFLRTSLAQGVAAQWLSLRLQLLGALVTQTLALSVLLDAKYHFLPIKLSPGLAGLALLYAASVVNTLNGVVNALAETEQELVCVERVCAYIHAIPDNSNSDSNKGNNGEVDDGEEDFDDEDEELAKKKRKQLLKEKNKNNNKKNGGGCLRKAMRVCSNGARLQRGWLFWRYNRLRSRDRNSRERSQDGDDYEDEPGRLDSALLSDDEDDAGSGSDGGYDSAGMYRDSAQMNEDEVVMDWTQTYPASPAKQQTDAGVLSAVSNPLRLSPDALRHGVVFSLATLRYPSPHLTSGGIGYADGFDAASAGDVLRRVSLSVCPGQRVAVVGRTGSGKSSLLRAVLGLLPCREGHVFVCGHDVSTLSAKHLRRQLVATVPQTPLLFTASLRRNLDPCGRYRSVPGGDRLLAQMLVRTGFMRSLSQTQIAQTLGMPPAASPSPSRGRKMLAQTTPQEDMTQNPLRGAPVAGKTEAGGAEEQEALQLLERVVVDGGAQLSVGQRMLLGLSRALLQRTPVVLLDEVSAALDRDTHLRVLRVLRQHCERMSPPPIVLCVVHRLEEVAQAQFCTHVLRLERGRVVDFSAWPSSEGGERGK